MRRRIAKDSAAAAKSPGEIVGLDFDPFLNFHYPAAGDQPKSNLLQVLKELQDGRRKTPSRSGNRR